MTSDAARFAAQGAEVRRLFVVLGLEMGDGLFFYPRTASGPLPGIAVARVPAALNPHAAAVVAERQAALARRDAGPHHPSPAQAKGHKRKAPPRRAEAGADWRADDAWRPAGRGDDAPRRSARVSVRVRRPAKEEDEDWWEGEDGRLGGGSDDDGESEIERLPWPVSPAPGSPEGSAPMQALASLAQVAELAPGPAPGTREPPPIGADVVATALAAALLVAGVARALRPAQKPGAPIVLESVEFEGAQVCGGWAVSVSWHNAATGLVL